MKEMFSYRTRSKKNQKNNSRKYKRIKMEKKQKNAAVLSLNV